MLCKTTRMLRPYFRTCSAYLSRSQKRAFTFILYDRISGQSEAHLKLSSIYSLRTAPIKLPAILDPDPRTRLNLKHAEGGISGMAPQTGMHTEASRLSYRRSKSVPLQLKVKGPFPIWPVLHLGSFQFPGLTVETAPPMFAISLQVRTC